MRILAIVLALTASVPIAAQVGYRAEIRKWQQEHESNIRQRWLPLVGLFWLKQGENAFGSDPRLPVPFPKGSTAAHAGVLELHGSTIMLRPAAAVEVRKNGKPVAAATRLASDGEGKADVATIGKLEFFIINRDGKYAVRVRDKGGAAANHFRGFAYYPIEERYRIRARFVPFSTLTKVDVPTVLGTVTEMLSPGYVSFTVNGQERRLTAVLEEPDAKELFFIFKDATAGKGTYPAGRFLYAPLPAGGETTLDFNKAHNPPCAFTAFATCPLPTKENVLGVAIEAGEKFLGH